MRLFLVIVLFIAIFLCAGCISSESQKPTMNPSKEITATTPPTTAAGTDPTTVRTTTPTAVPTTIPTIKPISTPVNNIGFSKIEIMNSYIQPVGVTVIKSSTGSPVTALLVPPDKTDHTIGNIEDGRYYAVISRGTNWNQVNMKFLSEISRTQLPPLDMTSYSELKNDRPYYHYMELRISIKENGEIVSAAYKVESIFV
jgi:uncharacterized protein YcfL